MEPSAGGVGTLAAEAGPDTDGAGVAGPAGDGRVEPAGALRAPAVAGELAGLLAAAAAGSVRPGPSQAAYRAGATVTGIRSCRCASRGMAAVVRIVVVHSHAVGSADGRVGSHHSS